MHEDNNMPIRTQKAYMMHSRTKEYKNNIRKAEENLKKIFDDELLEPVLEYSGGKDSIVLCSLALQLDPSWHVWNFHPGYAHSTRTYLRSEEIHNEIMKTLTTLPVPPSHVHVDNKPPTDKKELEKYRLYDYFDCLFRYMDEHELSVELLGIRGQESITRKHRVKQPLIHMEGERIVSFPIRHLTTDDVWAYIISNDIYYVSHYDRYASTYGYYECRFTSHYNENEVSNGGSYFFDKIMEM